MPTSISAANPDSAGTLGSFANVGTGTASGGGGRNGAGAGAVSSSNFLSAYYTYKSLTPRVCPSALKVRLRPGAARLAPAEPAAGAAVVEEEARTVR